jgi:hypothetical protein
MRAVYWEQVAASGFTVPDDAPLDELTAELTTMLGSPDPRLREGLAAETLVRWLGQGVYDDLLPGLADGMTAGLLVGLGEDGTDTVFRRAQSARVLGEGFSRDAALGLVGPDVVLRWGDRLVGWFVRERDLRDHVSGKGRARALAHGASALAALAGSPSMGELELVAVLDVVGERVTMPSPYLWDHSQADAVVAAVMTVLRRDRVESEVVEQWLDRLVNAAAADGSSEPTLPARNTETFLRALHLQLALAPDPPPARGDLLLLTMAALKRSNPVFLS